MDCDSTAWAPNANPDLEGCDCMDLICPVRGSVGGIGLHGGAPAPGLYWAFSRIAEVSYGPRTKAGAMAAVEGGGDPIAPTDCDTIDGLSKTDLWLEGLWNWKEVPECDSGEPNTDNNEGKL